MLEGNIECVDPRNSGSESGSGTRNDMTTRTTAPLSRPAHSIVSPVTARSSLATMFVAGSLVGEQVGERGELSMSTFHVD